jgi:general secretion pathway protein F
MPKFTVRVATDKGISSVVVDASDAGHAERIAGKKGQVLSLKKINGFDMSRGMTASERHMFMLRLSAMIGSKMSATVALRMMADTFSGRIRVASQGLLEKIEQGVALHDAISADTKNFPIATSALVKAGIESGETWRALRDAAEFEYMIAGIQKGAMKEMAAAVVNYFVAFAMMWGSVYWMGPEVLDNALFKDNPAVQVGWAEILGVGLTWAMGFGAVIGAFFIWLGTAGRILFPDFADKLILKIPFYKDLILSRNSYIILYKFGLLVASGMRMEECLILTADGSPKGALRSDFERALRFAKNGKAWANGLETLHPTDRAALNSSTDRKDTARTLDMLASQYRDLYMSRMRSFAPALQSVSALCIAASGIVMFGLTILPFLQLSAAF